MDQLYLERIFRVYREKSYFCVRPWSLLTLLYFSARVPTDTTASLFSFYNPGQNKWNKHKNFINFFYHPPSSLPLNSMLVLKYFFFQNFLDFNIEIEGRGVEIVKFVNFSRVPIYFVRVCSRRDNYPWFHIFVLYPRLTPLRLFQGIISRNFTM